MCSSGTSSRGTISAGVPSRPAAAALRVPPGERFVHRRDDLRVFQHPIGLLHPGITNRTASTCFCETFLPAEAPARGDQSRALSHQPHVKCC
jgi:hypothetical protein